MTVAQQDEEGRKRGIKRHEKKDGTRREKNCTKRENGKGVSNRVELVEKSPLVEYSGAIPKGRKIDAYCAIRFAPGVLPLFFHAAARTFRHKKTARRNAGGSMVV